MPVFCDECCPKRCIDSAKLRRGDGKTNSGTAGARNPLNTCVLRGICTGIPGIETQQGRLLGRYGGINEDFVLVEGWGECKAEGSQEMVEGVGKALV